MHLAPLSPNYRLAAMIDCTGGAWFYRAGVVVDFEVGLVLGLLAGLRFAEVLGLALVILVQFGEEGLVRSFREHALLFQDRQNSHRLFAQVHKLCFNSLPLFVGFVVELSQLTR